MLPVSLLIEGTKRFASGDLSYRANQVADDELGYLTKAFNKMAEHLQIQQKILKDISTHDSLTGLFNKREFTKQLKKEVERSNRYGHAVSLIMADIDHFKDVNDTYGHLAGDKVLRAVADVIHGNVRSVDIAARYGGEEIAIIMPNTSGAKAFMVAEKLRAAIASLGIAIGGGRTINITISMGVATLPEDAEADDELIGRADESLYCAKHAGRNRVRRCKNRRHVAYSIISDMPE